MKKGTLITLVDVLAFVGLTMLVSTGVLLAYLLPAGSGRWATIWGMNRHEWGDIHFWMACFFFSVLVVHLLLHWRFIITRFKGRTNESAVGRVALGLLGLIALIALALAPLLSPVERTVDDRGDRHGQPMYRNR